MAAKRRKSELQQVLEHAGAALLIFLVRLVPIRAGRVCCRFLGDAFFLLARRRRRLAIENLRMAYGAEKSPAEIRRIARRSVRSFFMTGFELVWLSWPSAGVRLRVDEFEEGRRLIREIYDKAGGIIFVTPHLGNWEIFLHLARLAEVPLTIVARPLDNPRLERLLARSRTATGQHIVHKKNAMLAMEEALRHGTCVGILADQSSRGIPVTFFGEPAHTTVVPALLAYKYRKPIVVIACVRRGEGMRFHGMMSGPLWADPAAAEGPELERLTQAMSDWMERFIRSFPDQWLWMHDRWKRVGRALHLPAGPA